MTAWQALARRIRMAPGVSVLVQSGAGGVGAYAIQMAKHLGASRILATCSAKSAAFVRSLGAEPIDYASESLVERVAQATDGMGVDVIIEAFGGQTAAADLALLAYGGAMACLLGLPPLDQHVPFARSPSLHEISLNAAHSSGDDRALAELASMMSEVLQLLVSGAMRFVPVHRIVLADAPREIAQLSVSHAPGKWVVVVDDKQ